MKQRSLGMHGPVVSALGLGCVGMTGVYGQPVDEDEAIATIRYSADLGINLLDTADAYGPHTNELLIGRAIRGLRDRFVVCSKVGQIITAPASIGINGHPSYIRSAIDASLKRLGVDFLDIYYLHRVDPKVPVEESVGAMSELVTAGKVRWLGLCETTADNLERAHKVHRIVALQSEYSLWARDPEGLVLETCRRLGVALVAYSPLGRAMLTGHLKRETDFAENDGRRHFPRFQGENFRANLKPVEMLSQLAASHHCTAAQMALAWLLARGPDVIPIPGTKQRRHLEENARATELALSTDEVDSLDEMFGAGKIVGPRYSEAMKRSWTA